MLRHRRTREFAAAACFALALLAAGQARAGCSFGDLSNAITNTPSFLKSHTDCVEYLANPAFLGVSTAVTAAVQSSSVAKNACQEIMSFDTKASGYQEKVQVLDELPEDVRNELKKVPGVGDLKSASGDLDKALSFAKCACALATESGPAQLIEVGKECISKALCWANDEIFDNPCSSQKPPVPHEVDCANPKKVKNAEWHWINTLYFNEYTTTCDGDYCFNELEGYGVPGGLSDYCYCPRPMHLDFISSGINNQVFCRCPDNTHGVKSGDDPVLARICLCNSTNQLVNADGSCPPPCECKNNQIVLPKGSPTSECKCGCPDGQVLVGESCVTRCEDPREIPVANGSCCPATQVSSCGTCCPLSSKPDASGSCVYAPQPPPKETLSPELPKPP